MEYLAVALLVLSHNNPVDIATSRYGAIQHNIHVSHYHTTDAWGGNPKLIVNKKRELLFRRHDRDPEAHPEFWIIDYHRGADATRIERYKGKVYAYFWTVRYHEIGRDEKGKPRWYLIPTLHRVEAEQFYRTVTYGSAYVNTPQDLQQKAIRKRYGDAMYGYKYRKTPESWGMPLDEP